MKLIDEVQEGIERLVEEAMAEIEIMSTEEAVKPHRDEQVLLLDIRDVHELETGSVVPGAMHAPRGMIEFWVEPASFYHKEVFKEPNKTFVFYRCSSWDSALATKALKDMGMVKVCQFAGAFMARKVASVSIVERFHWED